MTEKELLFYVLTKQFNKTDDEIAELIYSDEAIKEDAGDAILNLSASKVSKLKEEQKKYFDNGYSKAKKEIMERAEKTVKEKMGYDGHADTFEEMLDEISSKKPKPELTDDQVKKHPLYLDLEGKRIPKEEYDNLKMAFEDFKKAQQRDTIIKRVQEKAWEITEGKKPILSDNPSVSKTRREDFLRRFTDFDYEIIGDDILPLKDGKRIEDAQGNAKTFSVLVDELAVNCFDFSKQDPKGSPGTPQPGKTFTKIDDTEYYKRLAQETDPIKRIELQKAYRG
jgi:hypothetical protein